MPINKAMNTKKIRKNYSCFLVLLLLATAALVPGCKKDYYQDSGKQSGVMTLSSLEFLDTKPFYFDSLVQIIHLAGMDQLLTDSSVTFFAPTDHSIAKAMNVLNAERYNKFQDSVQLSEIPSEVWQHYLSRYVFKGKFMLKDILRKDNGNLNRYPGMNMLSYDGYIMNLGVFFTDYEGTQDVGPRYLTITDIGDLAAPRNYTSNVATSDIQTRNGIIHVLDDNHAFSFSVSEFATYVNDYIEQ